MTEEPRPDADRLRIGIIAGDIPGLRGDGLIPLRMEPPAVHGGLQPISFAPGLEPLSDNLLRGGAMVSNGADGERRDLEAARKRATDIGLFR